MFEKAARLKLRFETSKGQLTVEDLFVLPLTSTVAGKANLDDIARDLNRRIKAESEQSFVTPTSKANETLELAFDIVKHVIKVRLEENAAENLARINREKKQRILELIAQKKDEKLSGASLEELEAMANSL